MTHHTLQTALDGLLHQSVHRHGGVPGVVAMVTDRLTEIYAGAAGVREWGQEAPMTLDTVFAIFSTTKAMTATLALQLIEEGRLNLADPAGDYVPEIDALQVLDGFDADGQPRLRPPKRRITINDLLLHTSGLCYEFFSEDDLRFRTAREIPTIVSSTFASIRTVLLHEPGAAWTYGVNLDWLGRVIEQLRGARLGEVMRQRLFDPLGMVDIGFQMSPSMKTRRAVIHDRAANGALTTLPDLVLPDPPPMDMGGHGLYATVGEYMKFIRMVLNGGLGPHGRVLKAETVDAMAVDGLRTLGLSVGGWTTSIPPLSNSGDFFPGTPKGWGYSFLINRERTPSGRTPGSLMWAGLANSYFWIDRTAGIGGYWATQILPFQDAVSYPGFVEFETTVYHHR
ncbi:beta-lactamase family protein [Ideonella sp. B7]|uniref:serine hydrolase domain-containing protein n=1 Tax=Ideonella benzenivorans TaxID=2831643 RepID=UPI001CED4A11|nr:serine hydrolase domain-containing protein [Ideonella benzenivorans]MCA6215165.1 beta-lactamase family protein [Ideonella benzenivorans]